MYSVNLFKKREILLDKKISGNSQAPQNSPFNLWSHFHC